MTYFIKLNNMRVSDELKNVNLSGNTLHIADILNLFLLQYFDGHFLACEVVISELHLAERTLSDGLT